MWFYAPSLAYSLTGIPLPRFRQFFIETDFLIAHPKCSDGPEQDDVRDCFAGHDEEPNGMEAKGAEVLSTIINLIMQKCGNEI